MDFFNDHPAYVVVIGFGIFDLILIIIGISVICCYGNTAKMLVHIQIISVFVFALILKLFLLVYPYDINKF